jgi:hypothetical protein
MVFASCSLGNEKAVLLCFLPLEVYKYRRLKNTYYATKGKKYYCPVKKDALFIDQR